MPLQGNTHTYTFWPVQWCPPWGPNKTNLDHNLTLTLSIFPSKMVDKMTTYNANTNTRGFADGGNSRSSRRNCVRHEFVENVISHGFPRSSQRKTRVNIIFSEEDPLVVNPHNDDPLVIIVQQGNWDIKRVLIDLGSSTSVLFWDAFQKLQLNLKRIKSSIFLWQGYQANKYK